MTTDPKVDDQPAKPATGSSDSTGDLNETGASAGGSRGPSATAIGAATLRAAHLIVDHAPPILDDTLAIRLLDPGSAEWIAENAAAFQTPGARALRTHILLRSRYAEDRLRAAVERGVRQFAIVGAGLDTFAYRQPQWARELRIFELDHAASQAAKRARLAAAGIEIPSNVTWVAVDFEAESILAAAERAGFDPEQPAFLACLGVLVYLSEAGVEAVFRFAASLEASTEIAFTFSPPDRATTALAERVAALGEPMRTRIDAETLEQWLRSMGFSDVQFLTPEEAFERYLQGRLDGLPTPRHRSIASAIV